MYGNNKLGWCRSENLVSSGAVVYFMAMVLMCFQFLEAVVSHLGIRSVNYWVEKRSVLTYVRLVILEVCTLYEP